MRMDTAPTRVQFPDLPASPAAGNRRRLRLHELEPGFHCSVVGTCLSPGTAKQIVRRARLEFDGDTHDYRLHSILVSEAGRAGIVSRLITKTLDDSHAGVLRRVAATPAEAAGLAPERARAGSPVLRARGVRLALAGRAGRWAAAVEAAAVLAVPGRPGRTRATPSAARAMP